MKTIVCCLLLALSTSISYAQILEPVKWTVETKAISKLEIEVTYTAKIDKGWHIYSQYTEAGGPMPTKFILEASDNYKQIDKIVEGVSKTKYDKVYKMEVKYFENEVIFTQRLLKNKNQNVEIIGEIEYLACNEESCIPGYFDIEITI